MEDFDMPGGRKFTIEEKNLSRRMIKTWARFARLGKKSESNFQTFIFRATGMAEIYFSRFWIL